MVETQQTPAPAQATTPQTPAAAPAPVTPPPEKPLSPIEKAAKAWDAIHLAAQVRAKAATAETPKPEAPKPDATKPVETKAAETPPKAEEEPISAGFTRIARLERQARETAKQVKAEREALNKEREALKAERDALQAKKASAKTNPIGWLEEGGLSYDDVSQFQLNGGKPTLELQAAAVRDEIEALKKLQADAIKQNATAEQTRLREEHNARYTAWSSSVVDFVKSHEQEYELINQQGAHELVPAVIQQRFNETKDTGTPVVLSEKEAADLVEKHLEQQAEKLLQSKKLAGRVKPAEPAQPAQPAPTPTLNNGLTASVTSGGRPKSWAERKAAALKAMEKATEA